jgi:hypothetical protein
MVTYGRPVDVGSGMDALWEELRYTAGHVEWLRIQIQDLEPDALTWGMTKRKQPAIEILDDDGDPVELSAMPEITETAGVHVLVKLYLDERRHKVDVAHKIVALGLDERRAQLEEDKGRLLAVGLQWLFVELGLSARKLELANQLAVAMLRALAAGQPPGTAVEVTR